MSPLINGHFGSIYSENDAGILGSNWKKKIDNIKENEKSYLPIDWI